MSEYQRYEFMTVDRPLTRAQLDAVDMTAATRYGVKSKWRARVGPVQDMTNKHNDGNKRTPRSGYAVSLSAYVPIDFTVYPSLELFFCTRLLLPFLFVL